MALTTMLPILAATSAVGTAGSIAANVLTNKANRNAQYDQNQALMNEQAKLNQQNWETQFAMTNAYNDPSSQLARLQSAGLNPLFNDNAGGSSASPSVGSAGLPSVTAPQTMDYAGALNGVMQSILSMFQLKNDTALTESQINKNEADANSTNKDIVNKTNLTNSELAVNNAKVELMLKEGNLNEEQMQFVAQQRAASQETVRQKWHELELMSEKIAADVSNAATNEYTSKWQYELGRINARSNALQAESALSQSKTAENVYKFGVEKWQSDYKLEVAKYAKQCTNQNIDNFIKMYELSGGGLFGVKFSTPDFIKKASLWCDVFVQNMDKLDDKAFTKALPTFIKAYDKLQSLEFSPLKPSEKQSYNPAPWFNDEY